MKIQKRKFRIGELAKQLGIEKFVIRFWEKEFNLTTIRSTGGQRFYNEKNFTTFKQIKILLHEKGFTIAGAKKQLHTINMTKIIASKKTSMNPEKKKLALITKNIITLQKKLIKLRELF